MNAQIRLESAPRIPGLTLPSRFPRVLLWLAAVLIAAQAVSAQPRHIDAAKSSLTIHAYKSGVFSAFGHDHEIAAPIAAGTVDTAARRVELRVRAAALRVRDPAASGKDRDEIQKTMLGPEVLDAERHSEIVFQSSSAEPAGPGAWTVHGSLALHGATRPIAVEVREQDGRYLGTARLKQSDFGIKPVRVAGGTVKVKDELRVQFEIQLAR